MDTEIRYDREFWDNISPEQLAEIISLEGEDRKIFLKNVELAYIDGFGKKVHYRGLVEFSNYCIKDCFYCGIRKSNSNSERYDIDDKDILEAVNFAYQNNYGSIVLQSGERNDKAFTNRVTLLLKKIKAISGNELGITISLGEQSEEVYREWFEAGAHRYLLRIESSNKELYYKIHPEDETHNFEKRLSSLASLQKIGYQTGTGVMVGLPGQSYIDLAKDLLFFRDINIDMVGMGPFIEHSDTPLYEFKDELWSLNRRFDITINMIAALRMLMPDINIAAATALQAIDPVGREKALKYGANIIMPNITPTANRKDYLLYENKPCTDEGAEECSSCLSLRIDMAGREVALKEWGDSKHFFNRNSELKE